MTGSRWGEAVMLSWGWRRRLIAMLGGAAGALALPPLGLWPLLVIPFAVAVWLLDGIAGRSPLRRMAAAALDGWFWGFGYFVAGLWWLGAAFLVEADKFLWAMPLGVLGLPMVLALFPAAGFVVADLLWKPGAVRVLSLAGALGASEWARASLFTGFPWNAYGQPLAENLYLAQAAAVVGLHGLTALAIGLACVPAVAAGLPPPSRLKLGVAAATVLAALFVHGWWRVPSGPVALADGVRLRIMQPNLPQDDKFRPDKGREILDRYLALSDRPTSPATPGLQAVTHLIWPESAFPFLLGRAPQALQQIMAALPPGTTLVTGAARAGVALPGEGQPPIYNAIQIVTRERGIIASYDKHHLVPFGEYLPGPFAELIQLLGLKPFVSIPGGFAASPSRRPLAIPGLPPVAATICYEAIFPGEVMPDLRSVDAALRPRLLLNVTNDAWFGNTPGPHQHLQQARLRAIEEGIPLVRAANTGISAVIDPYGREIGRLPLGREGVLDAGLPHAIGSTTFSRVGQAAAAVMVLLCLLAGVVARFRH
jgi:apolipoprotein N-acyltransferase